MVALGVLTWAHMMVLRLETHQCKGNNNEHQDPAHMPPARRNGISDCGISINDDSHGNDPWTGTFRLERGRGNEQEADRDPVDCAGLPDHAQKPLRSSRLYARSGENLQLSNHAVRDGDKNGQPACCLKRQISHAPPPYSSVCNVGRQVVRFNTRLYGATR